MTAPRPDHDRARQAWDQIADAWAERVRTGTDHNRVHVLDPATLDLLGDLTGKRVLDAGCGEGRFARMMAMRGARSNPSLADACPTKAISTTTTATILQCFFMSLLSRV